VVPAAVSWIVTQPWLIGNPEDALLSEEDVVMMILCSQLHNGCCNSIIDNTMNGHRCVKTSRSPISIHVQFVAGQFSNDCSNKLMFSEQHMNGADDVNIYTYWL
jgi:hypothetical protein